MDARQELENDLLPWWQAHGADDDIGGVFTCFDNSGNLLSHNKYTWSQGRWTWLCAEIHDDIRAGLLTGNADVWAHRAATTAQFLAAKTLLADGRTCFLVDRLGNHIPDSRGREATSVFADLFAVLGLAAAARICPGPQAQDWFAVARTILLAAEVAVDKRTALTEPYPVPPTHLDLAEPMNLLHASAELLRAHDDPQVSRVRDRALAELLDNRVHGDQWWEFKPIADGLEDQLLSRHRTPGHLLEALWMVHHAHSQACQRGESIADFSPEQYLGLALRAMDIGWDHEHGGILRYVDMDGGEPRGITHRPPDRYEQLVQRTWDTKLWWVHSEAVYALRMVDSVAPGNPRLESFSGDLEAWVMRVFPDRTNGEWLQIRDRRGRPLDEVVALPVKDPFHIIRAFIFINRLDNGIAAHGRNNHR